MSVDSNSGPWNGETSSAFEYLRFGNRSYDLEWSRTLDSFSYLSILGEGTFGKVLKARDKDTGEIVALKKIKEDNEAEGIPVNALREVSLLSKIRSKGVINHVVRLKEIITEKTSTDIDAKGGILLVFEYLEHDLSGLIDLQYEFVFQEPVIKCFLKQLFTGLDDLHLLKIIHRDIKASNLLIHKGHLKIGDFGLAREEKSKFKRHSHKKSQMYTSNVITLWYRPPELLMGDSKTNLYSNSVDMWSAGCVLAEMLFRKPLFKGQTKIELLEEIFQVLGTPTKENACELLSLDSWKDFVPNKMHQPQLKEICENLPHQVYDLLRGLLNYNPTERLTASDALNSDYLWTDPLPCDTEKVPECQQSNEFLAKQQKEKIKCVQNNSRVVQPNISNNHHYRANNHNGQYRNRSTGFQSYNSYQNQSNPDYHQNRRHSSYTIQNSSHILNPNQKGTHQNHPQQNKIGQSYPQSRYHYYPHPPPPPQPPPPPSSPPPPPSSPPPPPPSPPPSPVPPTTSSRRITEKKLTVLQDEYHINRTYHQSNLELKNKNSCQDAHLLKDNSREKGSDNDSQVNFELENMDIEQSPTNFGQINVSTTQISSFKIPETDPMSHGILQLAQISTFKSTSTEEIIIPIGDPKIKKINEDTRSEAPSNLYKRITTNLNKRIKSREKDE